MLTLAIGTCALLLAGLIVAGWAWSVRQKRKCPSCHIPLVPVTTSADGGPPLTYEVLACPTCTNAITLVHGNRARYAWCPECRQRTLETPCIRLPDAGGKPRVDVHEHCHLCGHAAIREVGEPGDKPLRRGIVLAFPGGRRSERRK